MNIWQPDYVALLVDEDAEERLRDAAADLREQDDADLIAAELDRRGLLAVNP